MSQAGDQDIVELSPGKFLTGCVLVALVTFIIGVIQPLPTWFMAVEVFLTVIALFVLGSIRYRLDKNALTYGSVLIVIATFLPIWWPESGLRHELLISGGHAFATFIQHNFLTLHGLERLIHADTMLFILGLTLFVSVISQTRLLESISFIILEKNKGHIVPTIILISALVSLASGILDGVSMIGLMIRTTVIILLLSKTNGAALIYCVVISTVITTVCGMWLAYGEPPNLIMKANLFPHLNDQFFLNYLLPAAIGSYLIVAWNIRQRLKGRRIQINDLDIMERHTADVRFLQAQRHGEVLDAIEFVEGHTKRLGARYENVKKMIHQGMSVGEALVRADVPAKDRQDLLGEFVADDLAKPLDDYFRECAGEGRCSPAAIERIQTVLQRINRSRHKAQRIGGLAFIPFIGFLVWHAINHHVPLFVASFTGFTVAFFGIYPHSKMRRLALRDAKHEYSEYLFLFPLFFSITLLQKAGFFEQLAHLLERGIETLGASHVAYLQFLGATFLSALLDNNVVADFAARALHGLGIALIHFFAMAQIAGYALGGCWTHIGSAQSVVAYAFIRKEINGKFTPFGWIKAMTPVVLQIGLFITAYTYLRGFWLGR